MKSYLSIIFCFLLCATLNSVQGQQFDELKIPLSNPNSRGRLDVELHKGPITVKGVSRTDVLIRYKNMDKADTQIQEQSNGLKKLSGGTIDMEVTERENRVEVRSDSWVQGTILYIEVPKDFDLKLYTYNDGDILIENVNGEIEAESYNGKIDALHISGSMIANTYNGPIVATFDQLNPESPLAFSTYNGKVDISLPSSVKANLKLKSDQGDIYTGFDVAVQKETTKPMQEKGGEVYKVKIEEWIKGAINGGGPEIMIKNYHGDIYVRKG